MHILFTKEEIDKSTIINLSKKYKITHCPILISKKKNYSNIEFDKFGDTFGSYIEVDLKKGKLKNKKIR